jgi:hypothetical protein
MRALVAVFSVCALASSCRSEHTAPTLATSDGTSGPDSGVATGAVDSGGGAVESGASEAGQLASGGPYTVSFLAIPSTVIPEGEEFIAVDPKNPKNLVAAITKINTVTPPNGFTRYSVSLTNGQTWQDVQAPLTTSDGHVWTSSFDPIVAVDGAENAFLSGIFYDSAGSEGIYVSVASLFSGAAFTSQQTFPVIAPGSAIVDKPYIAVDASAVSPFSGNVYCVFSQYAPTASIRAARSVDHGHTWSAPVTVANAAPLGDASGSSLAAGPAGEVYLAYESISSTAGQSQHFLAKSTNGGASFGAAAPITPTFMDVNFSSTYRKYSYASLGVNPVSGAVYAVYADMVNGAATVEFVASTNGGATFSSPRAIGQDGGGQHFFPALAVDEVGTIHVSWFDTRNSASGTRWYDIYASRSSDGGQHFSSSTRVTPQSIDALNATFIGDYAGNAAGGGFAHPVWTTGGDSTGGGHLETATLQ